MPPSVKVQSPNHWTAKEFPEIIYFKKYIVYFIFLTFIFFYIFIYLFLAAWGLRCCAQVLSSFGERGLFFIVVHGLLTAVASLVAEHGL